MDSMAFSSDGVGVETISAGYIIEYCLKGTKEIMHNLLPACA